MDPYSPILSFASKKVRRTLSIFLILLCSVAALTEAYAKGRPFSLSSRSLAPLTEEEKTQSASTIDRLKMAVVTDYLKQVLGEKFSKYEEEMTPQFIEEGIAFYGVETNKGQTTLTGELDVETLNGWVRLKETKARGGNSLKPLFLLSLQVPGKILQPSKTAAASRATPLGKTVYAELSAQLKALNVDLLLSSDSSLVLEYPPVAERQMRELQDYAAIGGHNAAIWVHFSQCGSPGCGLHMDIHIYSLSQGRQVVVVGADVPLSFEGEDLSQPEKIKKATAKLVAQFEKEVEAAISSGEFFSTAYRLVVQGITSYRGFTQLLDQLPKQDYIIQTVPKRNEPTEAEFEILSPLPAREVLKRFQMVDFNGFHLKALGIDSNKLFVRYLP